jgi:predicted small lipoprotein YifL
MKKVVTAVMVVLAMVSLGGCVGYGKGKAPAPVVTNG